MDTDKKPLRVYIAGPFRETIQVQRIHQMSGLIWMLDKKRKVEPYLPHRFMILEPDSPPSAMKVVFAENCKQLDRTDYLLAILDDKDTGTIWEMGYVSGINSCATTPTERTPIIAVYMQTAKKVNVMLKEGCDLMFNGVQSFVDYFANPYVAGEMPKLEVE